MPDHFETLKRLEKRKGFLGGIESDRRRRYLIGFVCLASVLSGCGSSFKSTSGPMPTYQKPELMYLLAEPYPRLYVEIDMVEGTEPDEKALAELKDFLAKHCDKPGGIEMVRDEPIPLAEAKKMHPHFIALKNMSGPPQSSDEKPTAYMYILFYDSKRLGHRKRVNPHVSGIYPCAIYYDVAYWKVFQKHFFAKVLRHEAGHVLGLCKSTTHGDGAHCRNKGCLMRPKIGIRLRTILFGITPPEEYENLCEDCLSDLETVRQSGLDEHLIFSGPVLVRREQSYFVASLPMTVKVSFQPIDSFDGREMFANTRRILVEAIAKAEKTKKNQVLSVVNCLDKFTSITDERAAYERLAKDPDQPVSGWAKHKIKELDKKLAKSAPQTKPATQPADQK